MKTKKILTKNQRVQLYTSMITSFLLATAFLLIDVWHPLEGRYILIFYLYLRTMAVFSFIIVFYCLFMLLINPKNKASKKPTIFEENEVLIEKHFSKGDYTIEKWLVDCTNKTIEANVGFHTINSEDKKTIALVPVGEDDDFRKQIANVERILLCVNNHSDLVDMLFANNKYFNSLVNNNCIKGSGTILTIKGMIRCNEELLNNILK